MKSKQILKKLALIPAVSGYEQELGISDAMLSELSKYAKAEIDQFGNVIARVGTGKPTILIDAHIDEVGLMISKIEGNAARLISIGNLNVSALVGSEVTIGNRSYILRKDDFGLFVEANEPALAVGAVVYFKRKFEEADDVVKSPGLDNKTGCSVLVLIAEALKDSKDATIILAATVQHEQGDARGARAIVKRINPDFIVVIDSAYAQPYRESKWGIPILRRGPAIQKIGIDFIVNSKIIENVVSVAKKNGIEYQFEIPDGAAGGTDLSKMWEYAPGCAINIPVRYQHSAMCEADINDIENAAKLVVALVKEVSKNENI